MTINAPALTMANLEAARQRIAGHAVVTPLMNSAFLDDMVGGRVFLKCENLQRTGSFKFRGAYSALSAMGEDDRARGIVAVSSGNHAQGVAEAARLFGVPATIVMPSNAPQIKADRVRRSGATIVPYDRYREDRVAIAQALCAKTGAMFVRPYDDVDVMAGQGTAGLEVVDQLALLGVEPDMGLICCGGGGLCAGISTAWRDAYRHMDILAVEPEDFDDTKRSLASGTRERINPGASSICDAILTEMPGELTFPINQANGLRAVTVSDDAVLRAMAFAHNELKMVVEPGGVVCLAALLSGAVECAGKTVVAILSGGNADPDMIAKALHFDAQQPAWTVTA